MQFPKHTDYGLARFHHTRDHSDFESAKLPNMKGYDFQILGESQVAMARPSSCMILCSMAPLRRNITPKQWANARKMQNAKCKAQNRAIINHRMVSYMRSGFVVKMPASTAIATKATKSKW